MVVDTLLITATITPFSSFVVLSSSVARKKQYYDALYYILKNSSFNKIIVCENSEGWGHEAFWIDLAATYNKEIEFITHNHAMSANKSKGYMECELINYAVQNSKILRQGVTCFYKLTGRLIVKNINKILSFHHEDENVFILAGLSSRDSLDTRFFKINVNLFTNYIYPYAYKICDEKGYYMEHLFHDVLNHKSQSSRYPSVKFCKQTFRCLPEVIGTSGSTGLPYNVGVLRNFIRRIIFKLGLYKV